MSDLDKWDYELICVLKRYNDHGDLDRALEIWSRRNMVSMDCISIMYPLERLFKIVDLIRENNPSGANDLFVILEKASPSGDWIFNGYRFSPDPRLVYWERMFLAFGSVVRHTESKYIPGFEEYFENVWLKEGKP